MTQTIYLNADRKQTTPVVHMVQGDTGRELECHIQDRVLTGTDSAAIWCERPDGSVWSAVGTISGNAATFALGSGGPLNQAGSVKAQVKITDTNSLVVSTFDLVIEVHENVSGQSTPADETWRDSLTASLQADIDSKVPQTTKVNGKALSGDITLNAEDIPYDNTGSGLSATDTQAAIDEVASEASTTASNLATLTANAITKSRVMNGSVTGITASSTDTIQTKGVIPGSGFYFIALQTNTTQGNTGSAYTVRRTSSAYYVSPIAEGSYNSAPRIGSDGALKLNSNNAAHGVYFLTIKMD